MKTQFYSIIIIFIILVCSSCSITRQTACPTFTNKTEKVHKPLFSKKSSAKKEQQLTRITDQTKKEEKQHTSLISTKNIISKIEINDIIASSNNDIALNSIDIAPSFIESKPQKSIYKKVEKKSKKILKILEKRNQKKEDCKQVVHKKKHKRKGKKIFNKKKNDSTDKRETHELAIMSLIASIATYITPLLGLAFGYAWIFIVSGAILAILAIVWGAIANNKISKNPEKYKGNLMLLTASMLGAIALTALFALFILLIVTV